MKQIISNILIFKKEIDNDVFLNKRTGDGKDVNYLKLQNSFGDISKWNFVNEVDDILPVLTQYEKLGIIDSNYKLLGQTWIETCIIKLNRCGIECLMNINGTSYLFLRSDYSCHNKYETALQLSPINTITGNLISDMFYLTPLSFKLMHALGVQIVRNKKINYYLNM